MTVKNKDRKNSITSDYTKIPNELWKLGLSKEATLLYIYLLTHKHNYSLSKSQIYEETGIKKKGVRSAIEELTKKGMLTYTEGKFGHGGGHTSTYELLDQPDFTKKVEETHKEPTKKPTTQTKPNPTSQGFSVMELAEILDSASSSTGELHLLNKYIKKWKESGTFPEKFQEDTKELIFQARKHQMNPVSCRKPLREPAEVYQISDYDTNNYGMTREELDYLESTYNDDDLCM